jgi:hypothetical protein
MTCAKQQIFFQPPNDLSPTQNFLLLRPSTLKNLPPTQPSLPNISPPLFNPPTPPEAFIQDLQRLDEDAIVDVSTMAQRVPLATASSVS